MSKRFKIGEKVALVEDLPDIGLYRGQVGTIVQEYDPGVYDVEFNFLKGRDSLIVTTLRAGMLMRLQPVRR